MSDQREKAIQAEVSRRFNNRIGALFQFDQPVDEDKERQSIENAVRADFDRKEMAAANQKKVNDHNTRARVTDQLNREKAQLEQNK